jgi:hypothetical protein
MWSEDGCNLGVCLEQDKQIGKKEFQDYDIPLYTHPAKTLFNDDENRDELIDQEFETYIEQLSQDFKDGFREGVLFCEDVARKPELYGQYIHPAIQVTDSDYADAILQRDNYHAIADNLAEAIGAYFGIDIGEHSSANNPWAVALEHIESPHPAKTLTDEEILEIRHKYRTKLVDGNYRVDELEFARAILKKASKK